MGSRILQAIQMAISSNPGEKIENDHFDELNEEQHDDLMTFSTFCEDNRLISIVDEIEISEKSENRKYEYKLKSFQQNLARFEIKNGASGKCWKLLENDRIELENELISCKSQIDQL